MTARKPPKKPRPGPQLAAWLTSIELSAAMATTAESNFPILCRHLLAHPHLIARPEWHHVIVKILQRHAAGHAPRDLSSEDTASMVDWWMLLHDVKQDRARRDVAAFTGKTIKAVRIAHDRYGQQKCLKRAPT